MLKSKYLSTLLDPPYFDALPKYGKSAKLHNSYCGITADLVYAFEVKYDTMVLSKCG
jgi:hypothetical protein